jgi:hypothetical protein
MLTVIASHILDLFRVVMATDTGINIKVNINTLMNSKLANSMKLYVEKQADPVVGVYLNHYVDYIERGRRPKVGKMPPASAIIPWARKNGIPTDASTIFLICRAIWRDGIAPRPVMAEVGALISGGALDTDIDNLFDAIFTKLFKSLEE